VNFEDYFAKNLDKNYKTNRRTILKASWNQGQFNSSCPKPGSCRLSGISRFGGSMNDDKIDCWICVAFETGANSETLPNPIKVKLEFFGCCRITRAVLELRCKPR